MSAKDPKSMIIGSHTEFYLGQDIGIMYIQDVTRSAVWTAVSQDIARGAVTFSVSVFL